MKLVVTNTELFETLFSINFTHKSFDSFNESTVSEHLSVDPDEDTRKLLTDHRIGFRFTDNVFLCYTQCRLLLPPAKTPKGADIIPAENTRFRFLIKANNFFKRITDIIPTAKGKAYYFSNRTNVGTDMYISHDAAAINNNDLVDVTEIDVREIFFGVIDIYSSGAKNNSYELFTGSNAQLRSPEYILEFRNNP